MKVRLDRADTRVGRALALLIGAEAGLELVSSGPADLVLDAGLAPAGVDAVRAALDAGSHWVDLCRERAWAEELAGLDEHARAAGRAAVCAAGVFCGLTDPFVRAAAERLVRVNEVNLGLAVGDASEVDDVTVARLVAERERTIRMLIGGEWSTRRFFGDRRAFPFPPPLGDRFGANVDCVDLSEFTGKPVRSASVRLTVAPPSQLVGRAARVFLGLAHRGRLKEPERRPARWRAIARRLGGSHPWAVGIVVRGIADTRLPFEHRVGLVPEPGRPEALAAAPALEAVLAVGRDPRPGAGPCAGRIEESALVARLEALGVRVLAGDMGGWRGPRPRPTEAR